MEVLDKAAEERILSTVHKQLQTKVTCANCKDVVSEEHHIEPTLLSGLLVLIFIWLFREWSIFGILTLGPMALRYRFQCSRCKDVTFRGSYFSILWFRKGFDPPETFFPMFGLMGLVIFGLSSPSMLPDTWSTYRQICGKEAILKDPVKAADAFRANYAGAYINWKGWYIEYEDKSLPSLYDICIQLMMDYRTPPQSDLHLCSSKYEDNVIDIAQDWTIGLEVLFSARLDSMGDGFSGPYLQMWFASLNATDKTGAFISGST